MKKDLIPDIGDDEIRFISTPRSGASAKNKLPQVRSWDGKTAPGTCKGKFGTTSLSKTYKWIIGLLLVAVLILVALLLWHHRNDDKNFVDEESISAACEETNMAREMADKLNRTSPSTSIDIDETIAEASPEDNDGVEKSATIPTEPSFVEFSQVETDLSPLIILTPRNLTPRLEVGQQAIDNPKAKMLFQAADVRGDNKQINGAFVLKGELLSRGQSKSGYCAIIDGEINLGTADATPLLEKAIETDGYFFRQYPLVAGGQIVENNPKNSSYRKALAKIGEKTVVIVSQKRLTLHEFSEALVEAGVSQAIYLIGSIAYGFAEDASGNKVTFGEINNSDLENINYIVWE